MTYLTEWLQAARISQNKSGANENLRLGIQEMRTSPKIIREKSLVSSSIIFSNTISKKTIQTLFS